MSILSKVKKLIGKKVYIEPIVDYNRYADSEKSYAGGSLADSNVLIVTNTELTADIKELFSIKESNYCSPYSQRISKSGCNH